MSSTETKALIRPAAERLQVEVPALGRLKLVIRLELTARGPDAPIWRVELPGRRSPGSRGGCPDRRLGRAVTLQRAGPGGKLRHWADAYERGHVKVGGDAAVIKLIANVIERQLART